MPSPKDIALGILIGTLLVLSTLFAMERRHSAKLTERNAALTAKLDSISKAVDEQRRISERNVDQVVKGDPKTRVVVKTIREAPNPANCATPGLETLRNVL